MFPRSRGTGTHVEHEVCGPYHVGVVFDDEEGVAGVPETAQDGDEPPDVPGVESDARLVKNEEGVHERSSERGGEVDPLHLPPLRVRD